MDSARLFRAIEGSFVVLFLVQALRLVFGLLLKTVEQAISTSAVSLGMVYVHVALLVAFAIAWFTPRKRNLLPQILLTGAIAVALGRVLIAFQAPSLQLYGGVVVIGVAAIYLTSLLRANWHSWVTATVVGLALDQLFRAYDSHDLSLRNWLYIPLGGLTVAIPWLALQIGLSALAILCSVAARRQTRREPYAPGILTPAGGLALGGFWAVEMLVLNAPSVAARWAGTPSIVVAPWLMVATALPLISAVRATINSADGLIDERLRGWVWLFTLLLAVVAGHRLGGVWGAGAIIIAQFMSIHLLWWVPTPLERGDEDEQSGIGVALSLFVLLILVYVYSLASGLDGGRLGWLREQGLLVVLTAAGLLGSARLLWREENMWAAISSASGAMILFVAPVVVLSLLISAPKAGTAPPTNRTTLRVATYNVNGGYDEAGRFQLESIALTVEASLPDVVVLQEADAGRPVGFGIDQVQFMARRLNMYQAYLPTHDRLYGVAILSRWPIVESEGTTVTLPGMEAGLVRAIIQDPQSGSAIVIIGAQLRAGTDQDRIRQLTVLLAQLEDGFPIIVAGDLAASPDDIVYQELLSNGFLDPDDILGIERGFTRPSSNPIVRSDYILVRGGVPLSALQVESNASDHRLVVVEIGLQ